MYGGGYGMGGYNNGNTVIVEENRGMFGGREEIIINNGGRMGQNDVVIVENNGFGGVRQEIIVNNRGAGPYGGGGNGVTIVENGGYGGFGGGYGREQIIVNNGNGNEVIVMENGPVYRRNGFACAMTIFIIIMIIIIFNAVFWTTCYYC